MLGRHIQSWLGRVTAKKQFFKVQPDSEYYVINCFINIMILFFVGCRCYIPNCSGIFKGKFVLFWHKAFFCFKDAL